MKIQTLLRSLEDKEEKLKLFENWEELRYKELELTPYEDCYLLVVEVPDEEFEKLTYIFQTKEEAMGAFLSSAMEYGWEEVPSSYIIYHAQFDKDKLLAGILPMGGSPAVFDHLKLEDMVKEMARYPRVVVYSYDVVTYIKDIYPEIDSKLYLISRECLKLNKEIPSMDHIDSLEDKLRFIEELLKELPPVSKPTRACGEAY